jgi:hypothetical protein
VATGTPEAVAATRSSYTGTFLGEVLDGRAARKKARAAKAK